MENNKKSISQIGFRYAIFAAVVIAFQLAVSTALNAFAPDFAEQYGIALSFLLIIVSVDLIGFPLIWGLTRKLPAEAPAQNSLSAKEFVQGILYCAGITGAGTIVGAIVHMGVSLLFGGDGTSNLNLSMLMMNSGAFLRILTVGILAPIFEELIFRKVLIDHLGKYGKWLAIAASGILFGLFHGNFSQFFYATGLGLFFAYIYTKTGKIRYTIAYHMIINLTSAAVTTPLAGKYLEILQDVGMNELMSGSPEIIARALPVMLLYLGWLGILGIIGLIGFILLCVNLKHFRLPEEEVTPGFAAEEGAPSHEEEGAAPGFKQSLKMVVTNPGMLAFAAVCMIIFVKTYGNFGASESAQPETPNATSCIFSMTSEITVQDGTIFQNGESGFDSPRIPFTLSKRSNYRLHVAWDTFAGDFSSEPGFLTVLLLKDAQGNVLAHLSMSRGDCDLSLDTLDAGEYVAEYYYFIDEGDFRALFSTLTEDVSAETEGSFNGYDSFGKDGTWEIRHNFELKPDVWYETGYRAGYMVGLGVVILLLAIPLLILTIKSKKNTSKTGYDERQELARGRAFKYAFFTMLFYYLALSFGLPLPFDAQTQIFLGVALGIIPFGCYSIWKDAYFRMNENKKAVIALFTLIAVMDIVIGIGNILSGAAFGEGGRLTLAIQPLIVGGMFLCLLITGIAKIIKDRGEEDE